MKKSVLKIAALTAVILMAFLGCDMLQDGLSSELNAVVAGNVGTGSIATTDYTYLGFKDSVLTTTDVAVPVVYTKPVNVSSASLALTVSFKQLDESVATIPLNVTSNVGTLSTDKLTYTLSMVEALKLLDGSKLLADGNLTVGLVVKGVKSATEKDGLGNLRAVPDVAKTIVLKPFGTKNGEANINTYADPAGKTADFVFADAITLPSTITYDVASLVEGVDKSDFALSLSTDKKTLTVTVGAGNGLAKAAGEVTITVTNVTFAGSTTASLNLTLNLVSTAPQDEPAWQHVDIIGGLEGWTGTHMTYSGQDNWVAKVTVAADKLSGDFLVRIGWDWNADFKGKFGNTVKSSATPSGSTMISNGQDAGLTLPSAGDYYFVFNQKTNNLYYTKVGTNAAGARAGWALTFQGDLSGTITYVGNDYWVAVTDFANAWSGADTIDFKLQTDGGWTNALAAGALNNTTQFYVVNGSNTGSDFKYNVTTGKTKYVLLLNQTTGSEKLRVSAAE